MSDRLQPESGQCDGLARRARMVAVRSVIPRYPAARHTFGRTLKRAASQVRHDMLEAVTPRAPQPPRSAPRFAPALCKILACRAHGTRRMNRQ